MKLSHYIILHHIKWSSHSKASYVWPHAAIWMSPSHRDQRAAVVVGNKEVPSSERLSGQTLSSCTYLTSVSYISVLIQRRSAHSAVVLPGTFSAGALRGCGFKAGCHEAGSTENRPRTSSLDKMITPAKLITLSAVTAGMHGQVNQIFYAF